MLHLNEQNLDLAQIEAIVADIEKEKEAGEFLPLPSGHLTNPAAEAERKRSRLAATAAGQAAMASRATGGESAAQ
jgi:20S proteasome subunit alpha 4